MFPSLAARETCVAETNFAARKTESVFAWRHMFRTQNLCPGIKNVFDSMAKTFFVSEQQNLFPQHMFPARLNWETFASATMFPSLARPLQIPVMLSFLSMFFLLPLSTSK